MEKIQYDMIYLAACGVNKALPEKSFLEALDMEKVYRLSVAHYLEALVGTTLKQAGISVSKSWVEHISKAVRKNILFDAEREKLFAFMEQNGIWYMPLKGIVLKDYYPAVGMRQMSDNDILFDERFWNEVQKYMESQGYKCTSVGKNNHDVYEKEPVYNFELHRSLYGATHQNEMEEYYKDIKDKLVSDSDTSYGYHFTDEDFYVYIVSHAYKHYSGSGTGLRSLLDFYVYLKAKEQEMDFAYIEKECEVLGIAEFERKNRSLCKKVFNVNELKGMESLKQQLSAEEQKMLLYYLSSGVYGTVEREVENGINRLKEENVKNSKMRYVLQRLFPGNDTYKHYSGKCRCKFMQSIFGWGNRLFVVLFTKSRRERILREIKAVKKVKGFKCNGNSSQSFW